VGLLARVLGGRTADTAVDATIEDAVRVVPGVRGVSLSFDHRPHASSAVCGEVEVADGTVFMDVLRTVRLVLGGVLGGDADRVVLYCSGLLPDGSTVTPGELGLSQRPTGREVAQRLLDR
jgi:hypothetical protein